MRLKEALSETVDQFVDTAKGTGNTWFKFAQENPLAQELKIRYPESLKKGTAFIEEQSFQLKKLLKLEKLKNKRERSSVDSETRSAS